MPLVTLVSPVAVWRPLAVAGQSLESTQRLATSAPSEFDLGRFMECERGLSHVGQRITTEAIGREARAEVADAGEAAGRRHGRDGLLSQPISFGCNKPPARWTRGRVFFS